MPSNKSRKSWSCPNLLKPCLSLSFLQEYSVTFSSYFNVLWQEPRLHISERFLRELNATSPDTMIPVNLELVNELWLPNIFIYNLKTFKVRFSQNF